MIGQALRALEVMYVSISLIERKIPNPGFVAVVGFIDVGLVGLITTQHIVKSLKMEEIASINLKEMLVVSVKEGVAKFPMRFHYSSNKNLLVFTTDVVLTPDVIPAVAEVVCEYVERRGVKEVYAVGGIPSARRFQEGPRVHWVPTSEEEEKGSLQEGLLIGPTASILKECMVRDIKVWGMLVEAYPEFPDPGAAAKAIEELNAKLNIGVNTESLYKEAEKIKLKLQELAKQASQASREVRSTMYA